MAVLCISMLTGCVTKNPSDSMKIANEYVDGFYKFYELGGQYTEQGLQLQADYAYGWSAASLSSMRYCVECLMYLKGEGDTLEELVDGRRADWDEIAALNFASPYPWFFEGLICHIQNQNDEAVACYEKALMNPAFSAEYGEALMVLAAMSKRELRLLEEKLVEMENQVLAAYSPEYTVYPRSAMGYDDKYLRALAQETLAADNTDYAGALRHYEAALAANPFDGDNFVGCALMYLYLDDISKACFYINEGLFVDPEHDGLNQIADVVNEEVSAYE